MEIKVPTHINDITLEEFQKYSNIKKDSDRDFKVFKTIEIFCGVDISLVSKMSLKDVESIYEEIQDVLQQDTKLQTRIEVDGVNYGFIPHLEKISIGEYIDLENGLSDIKHFNKAIAVLYRPIVKDYKNLYTIEPYEGDLEALERVKKFPLGVVSSAVVFFYNIVNELLQVSPHYSNKFQMKSLNILDTQERSSFIKNGDGSIVFMPSVEGLL